MSLSFWSRVQRAGLLRASAACALPARRFSHQDTMWNCSEEVGGII